MVQQHGGAPLCGARASDQHHQRHLLGVSAGDGVHGAEAADAPRDADAADAFDARIGVRRVAGVELVAGADELNPLLHQPVHEAQHIVARHAECVSEPGLLEASDEIGSDGGLCHGARMGLAASHQATRLLNLFFFLVRPIVLASVNNGAPPQMAIRSPKHK